MNKPILIIRLIFLCAIFAPIVVYLINFGTKISTDHGRWAEFGSAIGGIYSPLVAALTLAMLAKQVQLQANMNVHESDQAYLQQARDDIEFYSTQMAKILTCNMFPGENLRAVLHASFEPQSASELDSQQLHQLAARIHSQFPPTFDIWAAIYPILIGLKAGKTSVYEMTYFSSKQKLIALLSFETCVALDNFHRVRTKGSLNNHRLKPVGLRLYGLKVQGYASTKRRVLTPPSQNPLSFQARNGAPGTA